MLIWLFTRASAFWFETALYTAIASTPMIPGQSRRSKLGCAWPNGASSGSKTAFAIRLKVCIREPVRKTWARSGSRPADRHGEHGTRRAAHDVFGMAAAA